MTTSMNQKAIIKRVKYLLNSVHISFDLAKALKWRQLYKLLKRAQSLDSKLDMSKKELKQFSKDIVDMNFEVKKESSVAKVFEITFEETTEAKETFKFIPFVKPFVKFFQDEHPLLLI